MRIGIRPLSWLVAALPGAAVLGLGLTSQANQACGAEAEVSFSQDILPLLKWKCASCH
jgi:hypothetical protein